MLTVDKITNIFCAVDDFCIEFDKEIKSKLIQSGNKKRNRKFTLSTSEVITIMIGFHLSDMRNFKAYYLETISNKFNKEFKYLVSYNRFTELMKYAILPMSIFLKRKALGSCTGISFVDSTTIDVCDNRRIQSNKVFKSLAQRGKSSTGWFYGFKLHFLCNDIGEIVNFSITKGNVDDRNNDVIEKLFKNVFGKAYGDRGYLSAELSKMLLNKGVHLMTRIKSNMKNQLMSLQDKLNLRKRAIIESINDILKNGCYLEHSRHRSINNFMCNLISCLVAYNFLEKKPSLKIDQIKDNQLMFV